MVIVVGGKALLLNHLSNLTGFLPSCIFICPLTVIGSLYSINMQNTDEGIMVIKTQI